MLEWQVLTLGEVLSKRLVRVVMYCEPQLKDALNVLAAQRNRTVSNLLESVSVHEIAIAIATGEIPAQVDEPGQTPQVCEK